MFNKLFESSVICTLFTYSLEELDKQSTHKLDIPFGKSIGGELKFADLIEIIDFFFKFFHAY